MASIDEETSFDPLEEFERIFGPGSTPRGFRAPGRVNLIGEHTDYNGGLVMPMAIDRFTHFLLRRREDDRVKLYTKTLERERELKLEELKEGERGEWSDYVVGLLAGLRERGRTAGGFEGFVYGDVPLGAGLSSSAALEVSAAYGLNEVFRLDLSPLELVRLCQWTENEFVGANTGIMDQYVSYFAREGRALYLDTAALHHRYVDLPFQNHRLLVIDTTVSHSHASNKYNERRSECEEALQTLNAAGKDLDHLSQLREEELEEVKEILPPLLFDRTRHVVEANDRVRRASKALERGDLASAGQLFYDSHHSLRHLYRVSCEELDFLVDFARDWGILGARMTGGGFGGSTIHLVAKDELGDYGEEIEGAFREEFGLNPRLFVVAPSAGAREIWA